MNPLLARLHPYPFERLRELSRGVVPNPALRPIGLGIGEPRHPAPALVEQALVDAMPGLSNYPATAGEPALREACAAWSRSPACPSAPPCQGCARASSPATPS